VTDNNTTLPLQDSQPVPRNGTKRWLNWLLALIGPALFIWVLSRVDLKQLWTELRHVNWFWLSIFTVMVVPLIMARALRLRLVLRSFDLHLTNGQALLIRWVGTTAGDILPGRAGEFISIAYLNKLGYGIGDPTLALVLDRIFDLFWMAIMSVGGLLLINGPLRQEFAPIEWLVGLFMLGMVVIAIPIVVLRKRSKGGLSLLKWLIPNRWQAPIISLLKGNHKRSFTFTSGQILIIMAFSCLSVILIFLRAYTLALSLNLNISLPFLAAILGFTAIVQLIPISNVFGIGTREITLVYLFGLIGISAEKALSYSMLILASVIFQDLIGIVLWWRYPVGTPFMQRPAATVKDTPEV
jgi:uncharacterized protein (TIRG00374 family)